MEATVVAAVVSESTKCAAGGCFSALFSCCGRKKDLDELDAEYSVTSVQYQSNCCSTTSKDEDTSFVYRPSVRDSKNSNQFKSGRNNYKLRFAETPL